MKRGIVAFVTILTGVGLSVTVQAGIKNSVHDFSNLGTAGGQLCTPCHTPHKADTSLADAPLWNHALTVAAYTLYDSPTFDGRSSISQPGGVTKLCLSCHDGTVAVDSFGGNVGNQMVFVRANVVGGNEFNLKKTHPVAFSYTSALASVDGELVDPSTLPRGWVNDGKFECSSCHDVHDNARNHKILNKSNNGSALCLTCHIK